MIKPILLALLTFILLMAISNIEIRLGENVTSIFVHDPLSSAPNEIMLRIDFSGNIIN